MSRNEDAYSDTLRKRLADIRASAGVPHNQVALEVLYMLPGDFLRQYSALFSAALKSDGGESARAQQQQDGAVVGKTKSLGKTGRGPTVQGGQRRWKQAWTVQDDRMLALKTRIDKRIRAIGREIHEDMLDLTEGAAQLESRRHIGLQCCSCKTFLDAGWKFCPQCGHNQSQAA